MSSSNFGTFFLPGPTEVRRDVLAAMLQPMLPHRGAQFEALYASLQAGLQPIFRTTRPVYIASSSATGLMEAAIRCAPAGPMLALVNGAFSERFAAIAVSCGRDVHVLSCNWGEVVALDVVETALKARHYAAVTVVHSETSTGALTELEPLSALVHSHDALLLVDSVTGIAGAPVETDAWHLDFVLTGSQKALALPPGLAFGVASERFIATAAQSPARGLYFDLVEFEEFTHKNQTPSTPALSLMYAAQAQCQEIAREGIERRWARHVSMMEHMHSWVMEARQETGHQLDVLAPLESRSPTVTAVTLPPSLSGDVIAKTVAERGFVIGSGYGKLKKGTFRVGHMGDHTVDGLALCLDAVTDAIVSLSR
ncbi:MAG: alanine--glyoxylate aminotransferase family protein [Phycisphaerae bacterium]|nr:alanine--glyoxylate aminotransferase family protein [Gemmatimonadaceae bacterium]